VEILQVIFHLKKKKKTKNETMKIASLSKERRRKRRSLSTTPLLKCLFLCFICCFICCFQDAQAADDENEFQRITTNTNINNEEKKKTKSSITSGGGFSKPTTTSRRNYYDYEDEGESSSSSMTNTQTGDLGALTKVPACITRDEAFGIELTVATGGSSALEGIDGTKIFALSALFGPEIADDYNEEDDDANESSRKPIQLTTPKDVNMTGCEEVGKDAADASEYKNKCVVIKRGGCSFETKAQIAQNKGAKCVIIVNDGEDLGSMTCDSDLSIDIPVMNVIEKDGKMLTTAYELDGTVEMRKLKDGLISTETALCSSSRCYRSR
jgi:hypothetical protein